MIRNDLNLDYKDFLKQYVISPICDYTISFSFKNVHYQFDYVGVPQITGHKTAYDFITYENEWTVILSRCHYKTLKDALLKVRIDGKTFEDIYNSEDSELIDIS